ncbi:hypothetical protein [Undibacterium sp. TS12]|uniref:hypothetical protein n=1 Tax=Undibacterium sp. TS12 TaxID=2908202 RepID=UPI001F4CD387|nr:hypothetical protein [Undibacterium sp. TS12]MCH8620463.1 hypothetical protein [Undibacterium sp. TS12]
MNADLEQVLELDQGLRRTHQFAVYDQKFSPSAEHQAAVDKALSDMRVADQNNHAIVEGIFNTCGAPDARLLSYKANTALFLTIQHGSKADRITYFPYFEKQYQDNQLHSFRYVMMVDRMRFDQGKGQLYGTQFFPNKEGVDAYGNVEEPEKINERREKMGMTRLLVFDEVYPPKTEQGKSMEKSR